MGLFHVSEGANIKEFIPRIPTRDNMDKTKWLAWAINEQYLFNYLIPQDCQE